MGPETAPSNPRNRYCLLNQLKLREMLAPKHTHKHVTHTGAILNLEDKTEKVLSLSSQIVAIAYDELGKKMYGLKSGSGGGYELSNDRTIPLEGFSMQVVSNASYTIGESSNLEFILLRGNLMLIASLIKLPTIVFVILYRRASL